MRSFQRFAAGFGLSLVALTVATSIAEAQSKRGPLRVIVQKRSYFDAGNVVAVGSMNHYATPAHERLAGLCQHGVVLWRGHAAGRDRLGRQPLRQQLRRRRASEASHQVGPSARPRLTDTTFIPGLPRDPSSSAMVPCDGSRISAEFILGPIADRTRLSGMTVRLESEP